MAKKIKNKKKADGDSIRADDFVPEAPLDTEKAPVKPRRSKIAKQSPEIPIENLFEDNLVQEESVSLEELDKIPLKSRKRVVKPTANSISKGCLICEKPGLSNYYGIQACRACAAMYSRVTLSKKEISCRTNMNNCIVKYNVNMKCKACRIAKCRYYKMAMRHEVKEIKEKSQRLHDESLESFILNNQDEIGLKTRKNPITDKPRKGKAGNLPTAILRKFRHEYAIETNKLYKNKIPEADPLIGLPKFNQFILDSGYDSDDDTLNRKKDDIDPTDGIILPHPMTIKKLFRVFKHLTLTYLPVDSMIFNVEEGNQIAAIFDACTWLADNVNIPQLTKPKYRLYKELSMKRFSNFCIRLYMHVIKVFKGTEEFTSFSLEDQKTLINNFFPKFLIIERKYASLIHSNYDKSRNLILFDNRQAYVDDFDTLVQPKMSPSADALFQSEIPPIKEYIMDNIYHVMKEQKFTKEEFGYMCCLLLFDTDVIPYLSRNGQRLATLRYKSFTTRMQAYYTFLRKSFEIEKSKRDLLVKKEDEREILKFIRDGKQWEKYIGHSRLLGMIVGVDPEPVLSVERIMYISKVVKATKQATIMKEEFVMTMRVLQMFKCPFN
uniref:Nuclear receptor n=1 Tax=Rhabditophanes sp. KR3021 TaxID=114890 RepID=A0AC35UEG1_9BILA